MGASDIAAVVVGLSAAVTAFFAWRGLSTWRRQVKGNAQYEAARVALRAAFRVRDALVMVRSPFMSSGEISAAVSEVHPDCTPLDPSSGEARLRGLAAGYQVRWRTVVSALSDLDAACVEAEALWGESAAECFRCLRDCASELNAALTTYLRREARPSLPAGRDDLYDQAFCTVFAGGHDDKFSESLLKSLKPIEAFFCPKLR